ncbi:membrane protein insertion efficiency factor YidD [Longispora sp. NPDC051575]|uniref:membrane protein insertion efficiency factor YidD n=1 Tax=Longispora sp. NPDC051575 TaxID=3154943 RepID=UPI003449F9D1
MRSRWLWAVLGALGAAGVAALMVLTWTTGWRRHPESGRLAPPDIDTPPTPSPLPTPSAPPTPHRATGGMPDESWSCDDSCAGEALDSCGEGCSNQASKACDDVVNDACGDLGDSCNSSAQCGDVQVCSHAVTTLFHGPWLTAATPPLPGHVTLGARLGIRAIRGYQRWLSPRLDSHCRYTPTCSSYGIAALEAHGLITGSRLAVARIRRCTATVPCGTPDPVSAVASWLRPGTRRPDPAGC